MSFHTFSAKNLENFKVMMQKTLSPDALCGILTINAVVKPARFMTLFHIKPEA
jgi:hypothetical protein